MTRTIPLSVILGAPVWAVGSHVGVVSDVYADESAEYVIGLEVAGTNDRRWFLPWVATTFEDGRARATSPLVFIPADPLAYYTERGTSLAANGVDGVLVDADGRFTRQLAKSPLSESRAEGTAAS
jgi:PRC-barrel domain